MSSGVVAISACDGQHTCVLTISGAVKCWGYGGDGQLGNAASSNYLTPVDVSGVPSGVVAISAGGGQSGHQTCVLMRSGAVKCWGHPSSFFFEMSSGVAAISISGYHTCAITTSGAVKCWGSGTSGQLGNGAFLDSDTPVDVSGLSSGVVAISATNGLNPYSGQVGGTTCALTTSGAVKCWGVAYQGQLGNGVTDRNGFMQNSNTPVDVSGLSSGVVAISAGGLHICALMTSGAVKCWGHGAYGQLGNGATSNSNTPVDVSGLSSGVVAISAGGVHNCALMTSGAVKCWGHGAYGQLGNGATSNSNTPVDVAVF
jgi:alpha-tubulin suppressor-like RCC1 family protein